jgi:hypothetical protein
MRIRTVVAFEVTSRQINPGEIATRLGIPADKSCEKGSRSADPPVPRFSRYSLLSADTRQDITSQIEQVVVRVRPIGPAIRELVEAGEAKALLSVVRYFNDPDGEPEHVEQSGDLVKLAGQHQLLGFRLSGEILVFLQASLIEFDADEYDFGET